MRKECLKQFFVVLSFFACSLAFSQPFIYEFDGNLNEESGLGPALTTIGTGSGSFVSDPLLSNSTVYEFTTDLGLTLDLNAAGVDLNQDYTIELYFRFENYQSSWSKILDYKNRSSDNGLYDYLRQIQFWPLTAAGQQFVEGEYSYLAVTRNATTKEYIVYDNLGDAVLTFTDNSDLAVQDANNVLHFFIDDFVTGTSETSTGAVRKISINDFVLTPQEIKDNSETFIESDVINFTLMNARTDQPVAGFDPIPKGANIDLSMFGSNPLDFNIRANVPTDGVSRVKMVASRQGRRYSNTESRAPYALFRNSGSNYFPADFRFAIFLLTTNGSINLKATACDSRGDELESGEVNFSMSLGGAPLREFLEEKALNIHPNPSNGDVIVSGELSNVNGGTLRIFNTVGQEVFSQQVGESFTERVDLSSFAKGLYIVKLEVEGGSLQKKLILE